MSKYLTYLGMSTRYEQYTFYGTTIAFVAGSVSPLRRAYFLNKYLHETEEGIKDIWAMRGGFNEVELRGGHKLLEMYRRTPRRLAILPLTFVAFEAARQGLKWVRKK
jgi:hypothetical protein